MSLHKFVNYSYVQNVEQSNLPFFCICISLGRGADAQKELLQFTFTLYEGGLLEILHRSISLEYPATSLIPFGKTF